MHFNNYAIKDRAGTIVRHWHANPQNNPDCQFCAQGIPLDEEAADLALEGRFLVWGSEDDE